VTAIGIASALAVASYLALGPIVDELRTVADTSTVEAKLALWPAALRIIRDFPAVGIGRGAFATVYPGYKLDPLQNTFTHVENEWLQLPVELGVVGGVAAIGLFAWAFIAAARRRDLSRPLAGALAGAAALVAHNLFDFSLEIPGVAVPFGIALGIASCDMPRWLLPRRTVRWAAAVLCGVALSAVTVHMRHPTEDDARRVVEAATSREAIARAQEALGWHPADYVPPTAVGVRLALERHCATAAPWLSRAMTRNPTAPEPHRAMAACLARAGQAALAKTEYRLAFLYGDADALREAYVRYPEPGALLELAPETPDALVTVGRILKAHPEEAGEAWRRAWESFGNIDALANLVVTRLDLGKHDEALTLARRFEKAAPGDARSYVLAAVALEKLGRPAEGLSEFELGAARCPGERAVLVPLGQRHLERRRYSQARAMFESIVARDDPAVGEKHRLIAATLEAQGRFKEALTEAQAARDAAPKELETLELFSRLSAGVGRFDDAIEALEVASRLPSARPEDFGRRIAQLRDARDEKRLGRIRSRSGE
jgi:tetratricopeptide (TPR) repeat protein